MDLYVNKVLGWNKTDDAIPEEVELYWKSITQAQREAATTHCGPHDSYPLGPGCAHVGAAFHLATTGHGSPNLGCIRNYARSHGCSMPTSQKALMQWSDEPFNLTL